MNIKTLIAVASLGLAVSFSAHAQTTAQPASATSPAKAMPPANAVPLPSADQILDHYLQATGGRDAWKKLTSRVSKGTIEVPSLNLSGTLEVQEKAPNQVLSVFEIGGATFREAFDGKVGWSDDPQNGLQEKTGDALAETQRDADFAHPVDIRMLYKKFAVLSLETVNDHTTYLLEATPEGGTSDKMYFDTQSGLLIRVKSQTHTPDGLTPIQIDLSDYREVDGIKLPFAIHQSNPAQDFTITIAEVHHNVDLDSARFAKPAAQ